MLNTLHTYTPIYLIHLSVKGNTHYAYFKLERYRQFRIVLNAYIDKPIFIIPILFQTMFV